MATEEPNILVLFGDDIGLWNISANNRGLMGYQTPNIDRLANEGVSFTDYYGQQRAKRMQCWSEPFVRLRIPKIFNLRRDPFERADENSNTYWDFVIDHLFMLVPAQMYVMKEMESFRDFPPRQKPPSFDFEQVLNMLQSAAGEGMH